MLLSIIHSGLLRVVGGATCAVLCTACVSEPLVGSAPGGTGTTWICAELIYEDDLPRDMPGFPYEWRSPAGFLVPVTSGGRPISIEDLIERGRFYRDDSELQWYLAEEVKPNDAVITTSGAWLDQSFDGVIRLRTELPARSSTEGVRPNGPRWGKAWMAYKLGGQVSTEAGFFLPEASFTGSYAYAFWRCYFFRNEEEAQQILVGRLGGGPVGVWRENEVVGQWEPACLVPFSTREMQALGDLSPDNVVPPESRRKRNALDPDP